MTAAATADVLSLPVLLSRVLGHVTTEIEEDAGVGSDAAVPSLAVWSNVLRCVADGGSDGIDERALAGAARISRRLATAAVTGATRRGWTSVDTSGGKSRRVRLTDVGRAASSVWPARLASLDGEWAGTPLRAALEELVQQLAYELAHFPASYGAADPSAVGGTFVPQSKAADGVPTHGKDWSPVLRADGDTVSSLPSTALLSQALMAFTIDYESRFPWPLASTMLVLCHLSDSPRPLADVPGDHGIAGNGKSLLERHLIATVTRDPADGRTKLVALTDRGVAVLHHHPARLAAVDADWRARYGDDLVTRLHSALDAAASSIAGPPPPDYVLAPLHLG
jgi:hypothetical protein